jgi:hypothetical protein
MQKTRLLILTALILFVSASAHATIISTEVGAGMKIQYYMDEVYLDDAVATATGVTQAGVSITGEETTATAYSSLSLAHTAEEADLRFSIGYDGNGYNGKGYMGQSSSFSNYYKIGYTATSDSLMTYTWSFDYSGLAFGLQVIQINEDGTEIATLGNVGDEGHHEGSDVFNLVAGNSYLFNVLFYPNVSGGIGGIDGSLDGNISFDFNGKEANPVPEPATMFLMGSGMLGLMRLSRKKRN